MAMNEFSLVNEKVLENLSFEQLVDEVVYADEALEALSIERSIVGDCEEISDLEKRFRDYKRKAIEWLGFDPSYDPFEEEDDGGDYVPTEASSSSVENLEIPF